MVSLGLRVLVVSARGCDFTLWTVSALPVRSCVLPSRLSLSGRPRRPEVMLIDFDHYYYYYYFESTTITINSYY